MILKERNLNNNRLRPTESNEFEPAKVGILQLLGSLRIPDIIATITVLGSLVGGAYQLGLNKGGFDDKFELYQKDNEITGLKAQNSELEAAASKSDLGFKMEIEQRNNEITDLKARFTEVEGAASKGDLDYKHELNQKDNDIITLKSKIVDLENSLAEKLKTQNESLFTGPTKPDGYILNSNEIGVNYWEYNHRIFYPSTLAVCRESCRIDMQCLAFTFTGTESDGTCYLKPAITGRTTGGPGTLISATKVRSR
jgi:PAN domain